MRTREDFFAEMGAALRAGPGDSFANQQFQPGQVKVRLLEAHSPESSNDGAQHLRFADGASRAFPSTVHR